MEQLNKDKSISPELINRCIDSFRDIMMSLDIKQLHILTNIPMERCIEIDNNYWDLIFNPSGGDHTTIISTIEESIRFKNELKNIINT